MKKVSLYVCEMCSSQYNDEAKAKECEKNHKKCVNVSSARYLSIGNDKSGYPLSLTVLMDDGVHVTYKR